MTTAAYVLEVDWNGDGDFGDANEDITADMIDFETGRGRDFASQLTGRAVAGRLRATLLNTTGKYSPFNTGSPLAGNLLPGRKVRLRSTAPVAANLWTGYLDRIGPETLSPVNLSRAILEAIGPIGKLNGKRVNPPGSGGAASGTLVGTVLDDAGWGAGDRTIDTGQTVTGPWFVEDKDALEAVREIEETELGFFYEGEDGKLVYEDRHHRLKSDHLTSQATLSDAAAATLGYASITEEDPLREIFNEARATVQPYSVGGLAVLWTLTGETPVLAPAETRTWWAIYPGPADSTGAYVSAWTTPAVGTDITVSGVPNSSIAIVATKFARSMKIAVTNNGSSTATLTLVQARGTPATRQDATVIVEEDTASQAKYGTRTHRLAGPWFANTNDARDIAAYVVARYKDPLAMLEMALPANKFSALLSEAFSRKISDRITIVATGAQTQLGINEDVFVEGIAHRWHVGGSHVTTFLCSPTTGDGGYWVLGTSLLGIGTKMAY